MTICLAAQFNHLLCHAGFSLAPSVRVPRMLGCRVV